jgi:hypothetical protein
MSTMKKPTTGGNAATIALIIFGIFFVIIVLGCAHKFTSSGGFKFSMPTLFAPGGLAGSLNNNSNPSCGITLAGPKENDIVRVPFVISGVTSGCNWKPFERLVGVATITDKKGKKIGSIPLQIFSQSTDFPAPFSGMFTEPMAPGKVTLKITNAPVAGQRMRSITIPIIVQ